VTTARPVASPRSALTGVIVAFALTVAWVLLTRRTGVTYHLFPFVIAAGAAAVPRLFWDAALAPRAAIAAAIGGLAAVALGWAALAASDATPDTTFVTNQPGGVAGEVVAFAVLGALIGAWWGRRAPR
jgi:hypothetical protein